MSGTPSEAEVQAQWRNAIDILEETRVVADGTLAGAGNSFDTLLQNLEGEYTPQGLAQAAQAFRDGVSALLSQGRTLEFLDPLLLEYGRLIGYGSGYRDRQRLFDAIYEHFADNTLTVQSRNITHDTTGTAGGSNIGDGTFDRLVLDRRNHEIEDCHVEIKRFRVRQDQNSGTDEHAELWECIGDEASRDALLRGSFGSGQRSNVFLRSHHAGTGDGGSLLQNASFSTYNATATPRFTGWAQTLTGGAVAGDITQNTTEFFRSHPGAATDASCEIALDSASDIVRLSQPLTDMRTSQLDPDVPYYCRVMWNREPGSGTGGTIRLRMGSREVTVEPALQSGWQVLEIAGGDFNWLRQFNQDPFDIELLWDGTAGSTPSGSIVFDDFLFAPYDLIDGTWWFIAGGATPWLVDDLYTFTDTGGAAGTGIIQWWNFISGLGYLPHTTGTPSFTDPT